MGRSAHFTVYGLRLCADKEVRYVGQTNRTPQARIANFRGDRANGPLQHWLLSHGSNVEGFAIAQCDSREEALATEKVIIALCVRLGHRLFNRDGVPKHLRHSAFTMSGAKKSAARVGEGGEPGRPFKSAHTQTGSDRTAERGAF